MAQTNGALGFEEKLWKAADKLRNNMDAAEYKHVVLGLIFLKFISDKFTLVYDKISQVDYADPEDKEEYWAENAFWVPQDARWEHIQNNAKQSEVGKLIDDAMDSIERENETLKGVLPKNYNREELDKRRLGELIDLIGSIETAGESEEDLLGRVYEYFLGQFASEEGKKGGEFYTPESIVKTLVNTIRPYRGRIYDPCCGSGGMFVQSEKFVESHSYSTAEELSIYGQESNPTTWRLAKMNLAIRGIENNIKLGDSFHEDKHPDLKADYILANPPFNISDWGAEHLQEDGRWQYGVPPAGNANFAWLQHMLYHLAPQGVAGVVLANGSMSSNTSTEGQIRRKLVENDLVDCMVALPSQLFFNTMIPACLWFLRRGKDVRKDEVLFIDARNMGHMISRRNRALSREDILRIADTYHAWRGEETETEYGEYEDVPGFCKSASRQDIEKHDFILTPGRYVGVPEEDEDPEEFDEKMKRLTAQLSEQIQEGQRLDKEIKKNLESIGYKL